MTRPRLDIFVFRDMIQIKRGRKSVELMPLEEADELGRDLRLAVAAARATRAVTVGARRSATPHREPSRPHPAACLRTWQA